MVEDKEEKEDDSSSFISDINKSVKIPKVNILGTDVKLDVISLLGLAIGGAAAIGTGYLLYDQYKNKTDIESARKKQEEEYRLQRIAYEQRLREEYNRRQQQNLLPAKKNNVPTPVQEEEEEEQEDSLIDMKQYYKQPEPEQLTYEQMLARANGRGAYSPPPPLPQSQPVYDYQQPQQSEPAVIDTDRYMSNNQQIEVLPSVAAQPKKKQQQSRIEEPVYEQEEEEGPTPDELYASLGNSSNYY